MEVGLVLLCMCVVAGAWSWGLNRRLRNVELRLKFIEAVVRCMDKSVGECLREIAEETARRGE